MNREKFNLDKESPEFIDLQRSLYEYDFIETNYGLSKSFGFGFMTYYNWDRQKSFHISLTFLCFDFDIVFNFGEIK